jgi:Zn-dependent peptidase ImmA (M78 family)
MIVRRKHIRNVVRRLLAEHRVSKPPVDVKKIAEALGAIVQTKRVEEDVSGFLVRHHGRSIIGVNASHPMTRQRFTIAHEIAHMLLHAPKGVHVDQAFALQLRNDKSRQGVDTDEIEANLFAAELLMPADFLATDLRRQGVMDLHDEHGINQLAKAYRVSSQAMTIRIGQLENFHGSVG